MSTITCIEPDRNDRVNVGYCPTGVVTTRTSMIVPPEARAIRAAIGKARSAIREPSNGTSTRRNIVCLLILEMSYTVAYSYNSRRRKQRILKIGCVAPHLIQAEQTIGSPALVPVSVVPGVAV